MAALSFAPGRGQREGRGKVKGERGKGKGESEKVKGESKIHSSEADWLSPLLSPFTFYLSAIYKWMTT